MSNEDGFQLTKIQPSFIQCLFGEFFIQFQVFAQNRADGVHWCSTAAQASFLSRLPDGFWACWH